jgi:hypothetical protein
MPVETRIQLRRGSESEWISASLANITNAVAANGIITYTASNTFVVGSQVTVVGVNPPSLNVTNLTILTRTSSSFTVASSNTGTYVGGGSARSTILGAAELGYSSTSGQITIGDGTNYWSGLKKLAWSNASQTLYGTQTITPAVTGAGGLILRGKADVTYSVYRATADGEGINRYYVTNPITDVDPLGDPTFTVTGFTAPATDLNLVAGTIGLIASDGLSFTTYSGGSTVRDVTSAASVVFKEKDTANDSLSYKTLFEARDNENTLLASLDRGGAFYATSFQTIADPFSNSSMFDLGAVYEPVTNASVIVGSNGTSTTGQIGIESATGSTSTRYHISFTNGAVVGRISTNASATTYTTSSDYRLKENVVPISDAADRVMELKPVRFNWIAQPDYSMDGFLAHEVQDIVPEAIDGEKDAVDSENKIVPQGIDQSKLVPLLTAALQEALLRIEALEAKVN